MGVTQLKLIKENVNIPVVGIGGINERNIKAVMETGIDGVAIVSAILGKENIQEAAQRLMNINSCDQTFNSIQNRF